MLFFDCYWSPYIGEGFVSRSCWKFYEYHFLAEHLVWICDLELSFPSWIELKLVHLSVLALWPEDSFPGFVCLEIICHAMPCNWRWQAWLPWLPASQASSSSNRGFWCFQHLNLPVGSLETPGEHVSHVSAMDVAADVQSSRLSANAAASSKAQKST